MRLAEWLKYVEEQEQKQTQDETTSPDKVSSSGDTPAATAPKNGNGAVAPQTPVKPEERPASVKQVESIEKPAQTSLFEGRTDVKETGRSHRLGDDNSLEIPEIEDFLPFLKPSKKDETEDEKAPRNGNAQTVTAPSSAPEQSEEVPDATRPDAPVEEKPAARVYKPVPPLFSLPADAVDRDETVDTPPNQPASSPGLGNSETISEPPVVDASAPALEAPGALVLEKTAQPPTPSESPAASAGSPAATSDTTALESLPRHIQALGRLDAGTEIAQNSYKRNFTESRSELIQRLLDPPISLEDAARILNVCPTTVRRYTNRGVLPHFRTAGNQRRFRLSDVISFMESQGQKASRGRPRKKTDESEA